MEDVEIKDKSALIPDMNEYQTPLTQELIDSLPDEIQQQLFSDINNIPFIKNLISAKRPLIKDLPRDEKGRAIVDLSNPPIITDVDYFRPAALYYMEHGCYTYLKPNSNPNSEYVKHWKEEIRRCLEGYVRKSDGAWVTGYEYWFLNYTVILVNKIVKGTKRAIRDQGFPYFFESTHWRFMYLYQAKQLGKHYIELSKRGSGKSYFLASFMSHNLILGRDMEQRKRCITTLAAATKEYLADSKDGTLSKFKPAINFDFSNTPFPHLMLKNSPNDMTWQMGYKDEYGIEKGSLNQVLGVSIKDDPEKLRGKRSDILMEECGSFPNLLSLYDICRRSVEDGGYAFAQMILLGTAAEDESDFSSAKTLLYSPEGYNIYSIPNVYDRPKQGKSTFGLFTAAYINRAGCYNKDGISDVIKALIEVYKARYKAKYSADPNSVLRVIAEDPITPAEAIIKVKTAFFPVTQLTERLQEIDSDPHSFDDVYVGELIFNKARQVEFKPTGDIPIHKYPVENDTPGAIEIFNMPEKDKRDRIPTGRYIASLDPVRTDQAESSSLSSTFVLDLWTDKIVAEYTGRLPFLEDTLEVTRKLCIFYNAKCCYEAHPYDQMVRLPDGSVTTWENIKVGDTLLAPGGKTTKVINIPMDGEDDIYKVTFEDGRTVEASSNHIWSVYKIGTNKKLRNLTTEQMYKEGVFSKTRQRKFFVPDSGVVNYPHKDVPIDPYTLGLLIAEGSLTKFKKNKYKNHKRSEVAMASCKEDAKYYVTKIPYPMKYIGTHGYCWHIYIDDVDKKLESLGLLHKNSYTKFIPELYLYNDYNTRLELLKGLMDGDGCAVKQGASIYVTISPRLNEDVKTLCRSLGLKCRNNKGQSERWVKVTSDTICHCKDTYRIAISNDINIFNLPRKVQKQHIYTPYIKGSKASGFLQRTGIVNIEYIGRKKCKCVTVDNPDGLYLIGDYVVTHNCNVRGTFAYFKKMNSLSYLAETPEYLRDKQLIKYSNFGSSNYGVNASVAINNYADNLTRDWLLKPVNTIVKNDQGEEKEQVIPNLFFLRNRALIEELIAYNPEINVDRVRSLGLLMIYREQFMILYQGNIERKDTTNNNYLGNDDFFSRNYDQKFGKMNNIKYDNE